MKDYENKRIVLKRFLLTPKEDTELQDFLKTNEIGLTDLMIKSLKKIGAIKGGAK